MQYLLSCTQTLESVWTQGPTNELIQVNLLLTVRYEGRTFANKLGELSLPAEIVNHLCPLGFGLVLWT